MANSDSDNDENAAPPPPLNTVLVRKKAGTPYTVYVPQGPRQDILCKTVTLLGGVPLTRRVQDASFALVEPEASNFHSIYWFIRDANEDCKIVNQKWIFSCKETRICVKSAPFMPVPPRRAASSSYKNTKTPFTLSDQWLIAKYLVRDNKHETSVMSIKTYTLMLDKMPGDFHHTADSCKEHVKNNKARIDELIEGYQRIVRRRRKRFDDAFSDLENGAIRRHSQPDRREVEEEEEDRVSRREDGAEPVLQEPLLRKRKMKEREPSPPARRRALAIGPLQRTQAVRSARQLQAASSMNVDRRPLASGDRDAVGSRGTGGLSPAEGSAQTARRSTSSRQASMELPRDTLLHRHQPEKPVSAILDRITKSTSDKMLKARLLGHHQPENPITAILEGINARSTLRADQMQRWSGEKDLSHEETEPEVPLVTFDDDRLEEQEQDYDMAGSTSHLAAPSANRAAGPAPLQTPSATPPPAATLFGRLSSRPLPAALVETLDRPLCPPHIDSILTEQQIDDLTFLLSGDQAAALDFAEILSAKRYGRLDANHQRRLEELKEQVWAPEDDKLILETIGQDTIPVQVLERHDFAGCKARVSFLAGYAVEHGREALTAPRFPFV